MRATRIAVTAVVFVLAACKGTEGRVRPGEATVADVIAGTAAAYEHFESPAGHFALELPGEWRGNFTVTEHADSVFGSRYTVEFLFRPAPGSAAPPKTLLAVRLFSTAAWERLAARTGPPLAARVASKGDVVYAASFPAGNPYAKGSPDAALFDKMVLGVIQDPAGLRLTPR
ncbi:MAG: hypothetical protein HY059_06470 [Proteobacteria bacterium]|nr:hypothetical protein [Pseudomonadota bacterium]